MFQCCDKKVRNSELLDEINNIHIIQVNKVIPKSYARKFRPQSIKNISNLKKIMPYKMII